MKKILILAILLTGLTWQSFGQKTETPMTKQDYLDKSKRQERTGWIMMGSGVALSVGVIALAYEDDAFDSSLGAAILVLGAASFVSSFGVLIASRNTADKAAELSVTNQSIYLPKYANGGPKSFPSLKLSIAIPRKN